MVRWEVPATKTSPSATTGTLNLSHSSRLSRVPAWLLLEAPSDRPVASCAGGSPGTRDPPVWSVQRIPLLVPFAEIDIVPPRPPYVCDVLDVGLVDRRPFARLKAWTA